MKPSEDFELIRAHLSDPNWRIRNLYRTVDKSGAEVTFVPWPEQEKFLRKLWFRNLVLKARQRGFSTMTQLVMLDTCLFTPNTAAAVIAHDLDSAEKIFRTKIKFAYDRLPEPIKAMNPLVKETADELVMANGSSLKVSTSARSATLQWLHISEYGKICAKYPDKAREIISGSLPAVAQDGIIVIESTAEGQEGDFYDRTMRSMALWQQGKKLSRFDYRFHFASWWDADEYEDDPDRVIITPEDHAYFERLEAEIGREIGPRKRAWYVATRDSDFGGSKELMWREYPSFPDESFMQSMEGVYLADQLAKARREGRITTVPHDPSLPVNTFWDLAHGGNDDVCIWFHQRVGLRDHFIDYLEGSGESYTYYVRKMQEKGYTWGEHYLPHDADRRFPGQDTNPTICDMLTDLGLRNLHVVSRTTDLTAAINALREDFNSYWFDEEKCAIGLRRLGSYRKEWNDRLGCWKDTPRKDGNQHAADALRQKAQGYREPVMTSPGRRRRHRSAMAA